MFITLQKHRLSDIRIWVNVVITNSKCIWTGTFLRANEAGIFNVNEDGIVETPPDSRVANGPSISRLTKFSHPFHNITHVLDDEGGVTHSGLSHTQKQDLKKYLTNMNLNG